MRYYYTTKRRTVKKTFNQLKQRYQDANGKVTSAQLIVHKVESEYETVQAQIIAITEELRKSINKLNELALKPTSLSTSDYLDILIESEKTSAEPGWQDRVQHLTKVKERVDCPFMVSEQVANFPQRG
ncbi:hypothetical protein LOD99_11417 [Oopsacas minuta]|uniref:Uncharacterized protein n=1 Tax=Oopsacas minuta TaxID=111878 RepID=A0AAV7K580_9METZ|nr:hypothetical protein LOD99_11417 [Oopsacas minuta]